MIIFIVIFWVWLCYTIYFYVAYPKRSLRGKVVLVTGGGSGIGRRMALIMAKQGAKLVLWDMNATGLSKVAEEIKALGAECSTYVIDVTDRKRVYNVANLVGDIDILINNAGIVTGKTMMECPDEMMQKTMEVNSIAHFWTIKAFLPSMKKRNSGHIVTISSLAGMCGVVSMVDYAASKFAAYGLHESVYMELRREKSKIRTTLVCPFYINTGMFDGVQSRIIPILSEEYASNRIVTAIQRGEETLVMPWVLRLLPLLRVLPTTWCALALEALGASETMKDFKGRPKAVEAKKD